MARTRKLYKLTDENGRTYGGTQWGEGVTHVAPGTGGLCTEGWLHAYEDPLLAVLLNPIHADFRKPQLWKAKGVVGKSDGLKVGCTKLQTVRRLPLPEVSIEQKVRFAILCVQKVCKEDNWRKWAKGWLTGKDRSKAAAEAAALTSLHAEAIRLVQLLDDKQPGLITWSAARSAAEVAAAEAAAWSAARSAAEAARSSAAEAARSAESAAEAADAKPLNLRQLARKAMEDTPC